MTEKGVTQLSSSTNSNAEDKAATPKAVKTVNEAALAAQNTANAANLAAAAAQTTANASLTAGNERKAEVVAALVALGVSASTSDSWATLISKMTAIIKATGNATAADLLTGKTASNANGPITGTMPNRGAGGTVTPGTTNQTLAAGYYSSPITVLGDTDLVASNIRNGVDIFGVVGSLQPSLMAQLQIRSNSVQARFQYADNSNETNMYSLTATGLAFKPRVIIVYNPSAFSADRAFTFYAADFDDGIYPNTIKFGNFTGGVSTSRTVINFKADVLPAQVTNTGFTLPVALAGALYEVLVMG
nr:phage tail protein [Paenibacillus brevis]